jgi:hypothetical protein
MGHKQAPIGPGALGNLALCLMHNGRPDEARYNLWAAVVADPNDAKSRSLLEHCEEVVVRARSPQRD